MITLLVAAFLTANVAAHQSVVWVDGPPSLPKGTKVAVLEGDPKNPGLFTMRLKVPGGSAIPPHTHPRHERVTVISGRVDLGFGSVADRTHVTSYTAGGFYVNPPDIPHYLFIPEESVLQLTCEGPWELKTIEN